MKKKVEKKTVEQIIAENNAIFRAASPAQKRVMIASDVITRINSKQYEPTSGTWVDFNYTGEDSNYNSELDDWEDKENISAQKAFIGNELTCECCALGGLMASCVVFKNNVTVDDDLQFDEIYKGNAKDVIGIKGIFQKTQLQLIEIAFEVGEGYFYAAYEENYDTDKEAFVKDKNVTVSKDLAMKAVKFGNRYSNSKSRMLAIMKNIVKNKGQFVP
jgi:hypothetical protein